MDFDLQNGNFKLKNVSKNFSNFAWHPISSDRELSVPSKKRKRKKICRQKGIFRRFGQKIFSVNKIWARALIKIINDEIAPAGKTLLDMFNIEEKPFIDIFKNYGKGGSGLKPHKVDTTLSNSQKTALE